jgi:DNA polymerase kappa
MAFFGFKPRRTDSEDRKLEGSLKRKASDDDGEWEQWPEVDFQLEDADGLLEGSSSNQDTPEQSPGRKHGKEIAPNPTKADAVEEQWWDCPICSRPQAADERQFNEHIDLCLSRQTIRETVQADGPSVRRESTPESKKPRTADKKRGRPKVPDPKQRQLFFG